MSTNNSTFVGTVGGTFLSVLPNINSTDVLKTVILAGLGAIVSFVLSLILKRVLKKHKK
ncbi:hypothetical protein [Flavobacterium sp.]|uniref:hypothetical protein n=1 Tax=Flavobacterium sp. TaxID=239 RepID=UPI0025EADA16|nr:hypothetical protein [Flavobacterium sp.]